MSTFTIYFHENFELGFKEFGVKIICKIMHILFCDYCRVLCNICEFI